MLTGNKEAQNFSTGLFFFFFSFGGIFVEAS